MEKNIVLITVQIACLEITYGMYLKIENRKMWKRMSWCGSFELL